MSDSSSNPLDTVAAGRPAGIGIARDQIEAARQRQRELIASGRLSDVSSVPPTKALPGYRLLRELHRGGQGIVFVALQESTGREVAIKLLRQGTLAGPAELARFEREAEVLGRLKHPHIVIIHDFGRSGEDLFLVMDYVAGRSLDAHVEVNRPALRETLGLFSKVCDGVNAAHLRGVIHRDLKPSNIRVDDSGDPRVLDFGLAKPTAGSADDSSVPDMTATGQFVGSLPWASPEQARGCADALDLRTDVYSLGVILYHLLTGQFPYPVSGRMDEVVRHIAETSPDRPSTLDRAIGDEVETILLKCLAKEPDRRYQSAGELARDLRHFLAGEPIEAKRDSRGYLLRKQLRRHWAAVTTAAAFVLLLTAGLITSTTFWYRTEGALIETKKQRQIADQRAEETLRVADFHSTMLKTIDLDAMGRGIKDRFREQVRSAIERQFVGEYPNRRKRGSDEVEAELAAFDARAAMVQSVDVARRVMDEYVLKRARDALVTEFADQPLVQAQLHEAIGLMYQSLGMLDPAERELREALELREGKLGREHLFVAKSLSNLAEVLCAKADYAAAEQYHHEALAMRRKLLGESHPDVASSLINLGGLMRAKGDYDAADPFIRGALAMRQRLHGDEHLEVAECLFGLAGVLRDRGDHAAAETFCRQALAMQRNLLGDTDARVGDSLNLLAAILRAKGDYAAAEPIYREALALRRRMFGEEHPEVAASMSNLAAFLSDKEEFAEAEPLYRQALALSRKTLGDDHPEVARSLNSLAVFLKVRGEYAAAEPLYREALARARARLGDEHPDVIQSLNNLAVLLRDMGNHAAAEPLLREVLALRRRTRGAHPEVAQSLTNLAVLLNDRDDRQQAEPLLREALDLRIKLLGSEHVHTASSRAYLARCLRDQGELAEAEPHYREAMRVFRKQLGNQHTAVAEMLIDLGWLLHLQGEDAPAEDMLREALAIGQKALGPNHPGVAANKKQLAWLLADKGDCVAAEVLLREALAVFEKRLPPGHEHIAVSHWKLAECLIKAGRHAEAEAILAKSVTTSNSSAATAVLRKLLKAHFDLYTAWHAAEPDKGYDARAAEWREKLAALQPATRPAAP